MEGQLKKCSYGDHLRPQALFDGANGRQFNMCKPCRDKARLLQQARRAAAVAKPVPETERVCKNCSKARSLEEFSSTVRENCVTCQHCRDKDAARTQERKAAAAYMPVAEHQKVCNNCSKTWPEADFATEDGDLLGMCKRCRGIGAASKKRAYEKDPQKILDQNLKRRRKRQAQDPLGYKREQYKRCAKSRGLAMLLTDDEMDGIFQLPCHYCGSAPLSGIDRVNNNEGYKIANCVPCCTACNFAKGKLDLSQFLVQCNSITQYQTTGRPAGDWPFTGVKNVSIQVYKREAVRRKLEFALSRKSFKSIISGSCYYCGKENSSTHKNGIDRKDSSVGYVLTNCVTCCWPCNNMKKDISHDEFIARCHTIAALHPLSA